MTENCPKEWVFLMQHVRQLHYEDRPDYKYLYEILIQSMKRLGVTFADPYDWEYCCKDKQVCEYNLKIKLTRININKYR